MEVSYLTGNQHFDPIIAQEPIIFRFLASVAILHESCPDKYGARLCLHIFPNRPNRSILQPV